MAAASQSRYLMACEAPAFPLCDVQTVVKHAAGEQDVEVTNATATTGLKTHDSYTWGLNERCTHSTKCRGALETGMAVMNLWGCCGAAAAEAEAMFVMGGERVRGGGTDRSER